MDMEKRNAPQDGTIPGQKAPPVLTGEDVAALEAMCGDVSGYFYKMLDYMDRRVRDGLRRGEFTEEQVKADLDLALWYSYACNNIGDYDSYYKAAEWMPASEPAAQAAKSGIWYYRYACALMYCGRLDEARQYAETGVALEPDYPWGWLEAGKLRAHFGDREGALEAVRRGLELVPGDYEFTTLRREIQEGRSLEEMEFHWIDPGCDQILQDGGDADEADKRASIAGICCDQENLAAVQAALRPVRWEPDSPYCEFSILCQGRELEGVFYQNEAAFSKIPLPWARELVRRLPELERRGRTFLTARAGLNTDGLTLELLVIQPDRSLGLIYQRGEEQQPVFFDADFSLREEAGQPVLQQPAGGGFLASVLLEEPAWDEDQFRRDLLEDWGIPCLTTGPVDGGDLAGESGEERLVFEAGGMLAAVTLYPFPVSQGRAEQGAGRNYLWAGAEEAAARHRGQLTVTVIARGQDPRAAGALEVRLVRTACRQQGVLGIYANGTVYQPAFYESAAQAMEEAAFPLLNLVWLGLYRREGGLCGYTDGLRAFGKDEIEVLDTQAEPADLRSFLFDLADYVLEEDVMLHDGETIGYTEDQHLTVTRSAGVWHSGMTVKIRYPEEA